MKRREARTRILRHFTWLLLCCGACGGASADPWTLDALEDASEAGAPAPVATPTVWGAGLGVSDLDAATAFFVTFLDLEVEARATYADRRDVVLWAKNKRGSRVTLSQYADGRNTASVPAKLLFLVADPEALYARLLAAGYASNFPPVAVAGTTESVAQVRGPDGYAIELSKYATDASFFVSLGFAVADAARSERFYQAALGMVRTAQYPFGGTRFGAIELPDETVVAYPGGPRGGVPLVLMQYRSGAHPTQAPPVRSIHYVPDLPATVQRALTAGARTLSDTTGSGRSAVATLADPDGYQVELRAQ